MPKFRMIYKAGKISFLLVCLFLCTACGKETAVFESGAEPEVVLESEQKAEETDEIVQVENHLVNINTAKIEELMSLPGIGQVRAAAIIEYRQREGDFETIEEIMNVKGIKTGIFSKINNLICVK